HDESPEDAVKKTFCCACAVVLSLAVGCAAHHESNGTQQGAMNETSAPSTFARRADQAQMNDVAILFPLAKTQEGRAGYISASDLGKGGAMLPPDLYANAAAASVQRLAYDKLKAVAIRIIPTLNLMRIVFQPLDFTGGSANAVDGAVHAYYSFTADD